MLNDRHTRTGSRVSVLLSSVLIPLSRWNIVLVNHGYRNDCSIISKIVWMLFCCKNRPHLYPSCWYFQPSCRHTVYTNKMDVFSGRPLWIIPCCFVSTIVDPLLWSIMKHHICNMQICYLRSLRNRKKAIMSMHNKRPINE